MIGKCRCCLESKKNMKFMSLENNAEIRMMFFNVTNFEWYPSEKVAPYLCKPCESTLEAAYNFKNVCGESQEAIQKYVNESVEDNTDFEVTVKEEFVACDIDEGCSEEFEMEEDADQIPEKSNLETGKKSRKRKKMRTDGPQVEVFPHEVVAKAIYDLNEKMLSDLKCLECGTSMDSYNDLNIHMRINHLNSCHKWCSRCNTYYESLDAHTKEHQKRTWNCPLCGRYFGRVNLSKHIRLHSASRPYECVLCLRTFVSSVCIVRHYGYHISQGDSSNPYKREGVFTCTFCKVIFKTEGFLKEHLCERQCKRINESSAAGTNRNGEACDKTSAAHVISSILVSEEHSEDKKKKKPRKGDEDDIVSDGNMCPICSKECKTLKTLQLHMNFHTGNSPFKCQYCEKLCKTKEQLREHERIHTGEKPYVCNICGKGFAQCGSLSVHKKQHTGKPEVCHICEKRFCRKSELTLHLRKHSGEKPFLCNICGKAFLQRSHLTNHAKTHSDQRPFACNYCDRAFKLKSLLTQHLELHSGIKNFKCNMCSYSCFKAYRLEQHMKLQHGGDIPRDHHCKVCDKSFTSQALLKSHMSAAHNAIFK